jgi:hypothetical protein
VVEGTLRAYYFQLRLSVEDYEFPHFDTGRDGNALACQVVVEDTEIGDSYLRHRPTLYNFELALALFDEIIETFPVRGDITAD